MNKAIFIAGSAFLLGAPSLAAAAVPASAGAPAPAAQVRVARFAIANMTCPTCPITVKTAMQRVAGVRSVSIDLAARTATVAFDAGRTTLAAIAAASTNAGFPATLAR